jgi:GNAT superfamily N-acetyltransferase
MSRASSARRKPKTASARRIKNAGDAVTIRPANEADIPVVVTLIHELAEYERLADKCVADAASVRRTLFGRDPTADVVLAFFGEEPAGYALFFRNYSTFLSRPGIYLEDLYVRPALRRRGIGLALLRYLAGYALKHEYGRMEWSVLRWNQLAIDFYRKLSAEQMDGWVTFRLSGDALRKVGKPIASGQG